MESLPDNGLGSYYGARALTSPSGNGVVLQHMEFLYEFHFDSGKFTWSKIQHTLSHPVQLAVMTYLPAGYTCIGKNT